MRKAILVGFLILFAGIYSCTKQNAEDLTPVEPVQDTTSQVVTCAPVGVFNDEVKPIIESNCSSCHSPGGSADFLLLNTHQNIVLNSNNLMATLNHESGVSPMPAGAPKLSDCDIQTVQKWVDEGMPDN